MKERLGTNLDALLGGSNSAASFKKKVNYDVKKEIETNTNSDQLLYLPVEFIRPGKYQPRNDMHSEALEELANSIRAQGIIQPIAVRKVDHEHYEIIAGERRWRAAQLAGLSEVPVFMKNVSDSSAIAMALIENIQREDLNPLEEAVAFSRLLKEFSLTQQEVATAVGKSRAAVANFLRLLTLSEQTKRMLEHGDLEMGHARAMISLSEDDQRKVAKEVLSKELSVRQTEHLVRRMLQKKKGEEEKPERISPDIKKLEEDLSKLLGSVVNLHCNAKGKGRMVVSYNSLDELEGIMERISRKKK